MTHLEAINAVEAKLTELGLKDVYGDPIKGIETVGVLSKFHGPVWDEVVNHFEAGRIDPQTYATAIEMLIEEFSRFRFRNQIEKMLIDLDHGGAA